MSGVAKQIDRLQNPEYTGPNRCMACTVVNSAIALALAGTVAAVGSTVAGTGVAVGVAAATLVVSAASIYFRGYLVPGTPAITKRYFPDWFLAYFEKAGPETPDPEDFDGAAWQHTYRKHPERNPEPKTPKRTDIDPEAKLLEAGALTECENVDDLCLTDEFQSEWDRRIEAVRDDDASRDRLVALLNLEEADVKYKEYDSAFRVIANGRFIGRWESEGAFLADVAAGELLEDRVEDWDSLNVSDRGALLNGLRLFIETCPNCGGTVSMDTQLVESCCRSHQVAALTCDDCEERLFESDAMDA